MTGSVVNQMRSRAEVIRMGASGEDVVAFRVEVPEVWDVQRIDAPASMPVAAVKQRALEALLPGASNVVDYVVKFRGFEVLNENASLGDVGVRDGSTLLITNRHRIPVR